MNRNDFFIIVNSTDSFSDCWEAFFTLFKRFWPRPWPKIILNSESLGYEDDELDIYSAKTMGVFNKKLTWSESIKYCCTLMPETIVLYLQDDYFFTNPTRVDILEQALSLFQSSDVANVQLTHNGSIGQNFNMGEESFVLFGKKARYLTTCQAALWNKHILSNLLKDDENAWQFEILGTYRARRSALRFFAIPKTPDMTPVVSYIERTGIIKGRWNPITVKHFKEQEINVDFEKRGFYSNVNFAQNKFNTLKKLLDNPIIIINRLLGR